MKFGKRVYYTYDIVDGDNCLSFSNKERDFLSGKKKRFHIIIILQFVCKKWFDLINSSFFITCHAHQSETVLIYKRLALSQLGSSPKYYFQFLDLNYGDSKFFESSWVEPLAIHASCDGLTLATVGKSNRKSLMLMNPVTRKHIPLPLGQNDDDLPVESYGIAFCHEAKTYKVVHVFRETSGYIGCEILHVCTRKWTRIEGPSPGSLIYIRDTVSVRGSFYWLPHEVRHDYFVSMSLKDESFVSKKLPATFVTKDRLMEIEGNLGFVTHAQPGVLQVWILNIEGDGVGEDWTKRYTIEQINFDVGYPIPVCSSRNGKGLVFGSSLGSDLYVYNFETKVVTSTYDDEEWLQSIDEHYINHTHTFVSLEGPMVDEEPKS